MGGSPYGWPCLFAYRDVSLVFIAKIKTTYYSRICGILWPGAGELASVPCSDRLLVRAGNGCAFDGTIDLVHFGARGLHTVDLFEVRFRRVPSRHPSRRREGAFLLLARGTLLPRRIGPLPSGSHVQHMQGSDKGLHTCWDGSVGSSAAFPLPLSGFDGEDLCFKCSFCSPCVLSFGRLLASGA